MTVKEQADKLKRSELWVVLIQNAKEDIYYRWQVSETVSARESLHARLEGIIIIEQRLDLLCNTPLAEVQDGPW